MLIQGYLGKHGLTCPIIERKRATLNAFGTAMHIPGIQARGQAERCTPHPSYVDAADAGRHLSENTRNPKQSHHFDFDCECSFRARL